MTKEIYTTYSEDVGITVILEDTKMTTEIP